MTSIASAPRLLFSFFADLYVKFAFIFSSILFYLCLNVSVSAVFLVYLPILYIDNLILHNLKYSLSATDRVSQKRAANFIGRVPLFWQIFKRHSGSRGLA